MVIAADGSPTRSPATLTTCQYASPSYCSSPPPDPDPDARTLPPLMPSQEGSNDRGADGHRGRMTRTSDGCPWTRRKVRDLLF